MPLKLSSLLQLSCGCGDGQVVRTALQLYVTRHHLPALVAPASMLSVALAAFSESLSTPNAVYPKVTAHSPTHWALRIAELCACRTHTFSRYTFFYRIGRVLCAAGDTPVGRHTSGIVALSRRSATSALATQPQVNDEHRPWRGAQRYSRPGRVHVKRAAIFYARCSSPHSRCVCAGRGA